MPTPEISLISTDSVPPRLRWACRRGMLELDLWLGAFVTDRWAALSAEQQAVFEKMLQEPDPFLYRWLTQQEVPADPDFCSIIILIRQHARR